MLFSSLISSLILIESREVGQSMLSQPFLMSIILIFLGFDPYYVLLTATATHLYFMHYVSSGASKYPEYPFAFFAVISSSKLIFEQFQGNIEILILLSFTMIIIISRITAHYIYFKRKIINRFMASPKEATIRYYMIFSVVTSFATGSVYAFILIFLSSEIFKVCSNIVKYDINIDNLVIIILLGIFTPFFFSKKKLKTVSVGIILAIIFYVVIR